MKANTNDFRSEGETMLGINPNRNVTEKTKEYVSFFGTTPIVVAELWNRINPVESVHQQSQFKYLLWALLFLTKYLDELSNCRIVGIKDPKWFRYWCWLFVEAIANVDGQVIRWSNRFQNWDKKSNCLVWVDCTDVPILEPWPFDSAYYSQKLNGPGYKYELALAINGDYIVWINGPFPAGRPADLEIFRQGLMLMLAEDEGVETDAYYKGEYALKNVNVHRGRTFKEQKKLVRARGENVFSRFKRFGVLRKRFTHKLEKHQICFRSVAVLVQLNMNHGRGNLFQVDYDLIY